MFVICAWCGKKLREVAPYENKGETHTCCNECIEKHFPHIAAILKRRGKNDQPNDNDQARKRAGPALR